MDDRVPPDFDLLRSVATSVRRSILATIHHAGAGHVGGPLSATDLLTVLYFHELRIDPANPSWADRDRFIFSKGHSSMLTWPLIGTPEREDGRPRPRTSEHMF